MTNLYNLSPRPRLLIIHGLNNNLEGFEPLKNEFQQIGYECHFITLPGHGKDRNESRSFQTSFKAFDLQMTELTKAPYAVIAFSQGALYLQIWLESNKEFAPLAQVLLAPALYLHHQKKLERLLSFLPSFAFIISQTPKRFRLYRILYIWEYRTLFEAIKKYQAQNGTNHVPTQIFIDPQDELVSARKLEENSMGKNTTFHLIVRPDIQAPGLGKHHILFHPEYFEKDEWKKLMTKIKTFITQQVAQL